MLLLLLRAHIAVELCTNLLFASSPVLQMSETDNLCVMSNCFLSSGPEKQVGFSLVPCVGSSGNADYWGSGSYK